MAPLIRCYPSFYKMNIKKSKVLYIFLILIILFSFTGFNKDQSEGELRIKAYKAIKSLDTLYSNYYRLFGKVKEYQEKWAKIKKETIFLKRLYNNGNYANAIKLRTKIKVMIENIKKVEKKAPKEPKAVETIPFEMINILEKFPKNIPDLKEAFEKLEILIKSKEISADDKLMLQFIFNDKKGITEKIIHKAHEKNSSNISKENIFKLLELFEGDKKWYRKYYRLIKSLNLQPLPEISQRNKPIIPLNEKSTDSNKNPRKPTKLIIKKPNRYVKSNQRDKYPDSKRYFLSMDVWQSSWEDFSEVNILLDYFNKNNIKHVNLNPGLPMGPTFYQEGYATFKPLVDKFYASGIQKVNLLYAERNYPIKYFAQFLTDHPELKIDTIVDDSEFIDMFQDKFNKNLKAVQQYGLKYSAFVTMEVKGNSGVSDQTRFWVLDNVDYPILMSYFSCELDKQKQLLDKYLTYADNIGRYQCVSVAILFGSKKVGREISCEILLDKYQMQSFLYKLDRWARINHPSYQGLVIETNLRTPQYDINPIGR